MRRIFTLIGGLLLCQLVQAQEILTAGDVVPVAGDHWFTASVYSDANDLVNLGAAGENGVYDFSVLAGLEDDNTYLPLGQVNADNAAAFHEAFSANDLDNLPAEVANAAIYLGTYIDYVGYEDFLTVSSYDQNTEGIYTTSLMWNEPGAVPELWEYQLGSYQTILKSVPFDIPFGETKTITHTTVRNNTYSGVPDSLVLIDHYTFDGTGTYTSPSGEVFENVMRFIREDIWNVYKKQGDNWVLNSDFYTKTMEYRQKGNALPLCTIELDDDWTVNSTVPNSEELAITFVEPIVLSSAIDVTPLNKNIARISPNPAVDFININWLGENAQKLDLELLDMQGKLVKRVRLENILTNDLFTLEIPSASGIYVLKMNTGKEIYTQQVVVK